MELHRNFLQVFCGATELDYYHHIVIIIRHLFVIPCNYALRTDQRQLWDQWEFEKGTVKTGFLCLLAGWQSQWTSDWGWWWRWRTMVPKPSSALTIDKSKRIRRRQPHNQPLSEFPLCFVDDANFFWISSTVETNVITTDILVPGWPDKSRGLIWGHLLGNCEAFRTTSTTIIILRMWKIILH